MILQFFDIITSVKVSESSRACKFNHISSSSGIVLEDAAPHGEVSRYADSSDDDGDWDSIRGGGLAACMLEEEALEAEDLEDQHFSFFDGIIILLLLNKISYLLQSLLCTRIRS